MRSSALLAFILSSLLSLNLLAGELAFTVTSVNVNENASTFDVTVTRTGTLTTTASVTVKSTAGTAAAVSEYINGSSALSWAIADGSSQTVSVTIIDDALVDGDKSFTLDLVSVSNDTIGTNNSIAVTIVDFEEGVLQFSATSVNASESNSTASVTVSRSLGSSGEVSIDYSTNDGTALDQSDYSSTSGTLVFADGVSSMSILIPLLADSIGEIDKSFEVVLAPTGLGGNASAGTSLTSVVTITDDDSDFTPPMVKLLVAVEDVIQTESIKLDVPSLLDSQRSLLETINDIPVLSITDLFAEQDASGLTSIEHGVNKVYFRPLAMLRASVGVNEAVVIYDDESGFFVTDLGFVITFQPSLAAIAILQTALAEFDLGEFTISDTGNISIQVEQGPPPLERDENGEIFINNSYYDRFNLRPALIASPSVASQTGIQVQAHPLLPLESIIVVNFLDGTIMRDQVLSTAPLDSNELTSTLEAVNGVNDVIYAGQGIVTYTFEQENYALFAGYIIRNVERFLTSLVGISDVADFNNDGNPDLKMIYSSGDEQTFYSIPAPLTEQ